MNTIAAPPRSLVQRMEALNRANEIRIKRAALKRDLKAGRASIVSTLLAPPECVHTAKVFDVLLAVPKYGRVKANRILLICRISPSKTIIGLSERQRHELLGWLGATPAQIAQCMVLPERLPKRRLVASSSAGRGASGTDPTEFQMRVLRSAHELGGVGPAHIDQIAARLETSTSGVGLARSALHRFGFIDVFGAVTPDGRRFINEAANYDSRARETACAA